MKQQKIWKLLNTKHPKYPLVSINMETLYDKYTIPYFLDELIFPPIGKLFAFDSEENAIKFQEFLSSEKGNTKIAIGVGFNTQHCDFVAYCHDLIERFWKDPINLDNLKSAPKGTLTCDSLILHTLL